MPVSDQAKLLIKLDFHTIRERLSTLCSTPMGAARALDLLPSFDLPTIEELQAETSEGRLAIDRSLAPPFDGIEDVRPLCHRLEIGGDLSGPELVRIRNSLAGLRRLRAALCRPEMEPLRRLRAAGQSLVVLTEVEETLTHALGDEGEVLDRASPRLAQLRHRARRLRDLVRQRMEAMARAPGADRWIQERIVTFRRDRPCLPVRVEHKRALPGILHDLSASGATVFIEPMEVVEEGNELQAVRAEEEHEIARILSELSARVAAHREAIEGDLEIAARVDFALAKGRLSAALDGTEPAMRTDATIDLRQARHPLVDPGAVVPNDLAVGEDYDVLLITGPNAGGKTVALKTIGLLACMAQAGLHVAAQRGSSLGAFREIRADIGDEQSIEQSLSTFSAHMAHLARILPGAGPRTLVLLDEVGWGTDPTEGAALAMAILRFLRRRGARVVATTHLNDLKGFAAQEDRTVNAAMEFDRTSLAPTYRLLLGRPGRSYALSIAARTGLPPEVITQAEELIPEGTARLEEVLGQAEKAHQDLERERLTYHQALARLEEERRGVEEEARRLEEARRKAVAEGFDEATRIVREARELAREVIGDLRRQGQEGRATQRATELLREKEREMAEARGRLELQEAVPVPPDELRPGRAVAVRSMGGRGIILSKPDESGRVEVRLGSIKATVECADLEILDTEPVEGRDVAEILTTEKSIAVPREISLRGMTLEEAIPVLEKYVDDALLAGHPRVRIIHGKGTGALREAVREYLQRCPRVRSFQFAEQFEGGTGVTVVEFD